MVSGRILISMINLCTLFITLESEEKSSPETNLKGRPNMGGGQINSNWKSRILNPLKGEC